MYAKGIFFPETFATQLYCNIDRRQLKATLRYLYKRKEFDTNISINIWKPQVVFLYATLSAVICSKTSTFRYKWKRFVQRFKNRELFNAALTDVVGKFYYFLFSKVYRYAVSVVMVLIIKCILFNFFYIYSCCILKNIKRNFP